MYNILYFFQDIKEIVIAVGNSKIRMYKNSIKRYVDRIKLVEKAKINREKFYEFADCTVEITNEWQDFETIKINPKAKWSVVIKTKNNGTKKYTGMDHFPYNWETFCNIFDSFFSNITLERDNESSIINRNLHYETIINFEYKKNGITTNLVNEIEKYAVATIEDFEQDRFWSDSARNFLGLLILANLNNEREVNLKKILYQISDINSVKDIIANNINELKKHSELQIFTNNAQIIGSAKTLQSVLELIKDGFIKNYVPNTPEMYDYVKSTIKERNRDIVIPKKRSKITQETLQDIYYYSMNKQEREKVKLLGIDRSIYAIKYINGIGYIVVNYIYAMMTKDGRRMEKQIYRLEVGPELNLNKAKKEINKYLKKLNQS